MPKLSHIEITVIQRTTGEIIIKLTLPFFCIEHMQKTAPEDNLTLMKQHIKSGIKPLKCNKLWLSGEEKQSLLWTDLSSNCIIHID